MDTLSDVSDTNDADKCHICLGSFGGETVASLDGCQHVFCLQCILQWSQTANTCPVDRISFAVIHPGADIRDKIQVRTRVKDEDDDEGGEEGSGAVICEQCGRSDRNHRLLVCMLCDSGHHVDCLTPSLITRPEGDWICPECAVTPHHTDGTAAEEEISDGEVADLLAEVDETAPTSSRLRPSTVNRPRSFARRRHSQRIRGRAHSGPRLRPQTSWHVPKHLLRPSRPAVTTEELVHHGDPRTRKLKSRQGRKNAA